ncbi:uncharacterized protein UDID_17682 [Ustilago sp. UG-2017a]|nr:uncharacterized protein UDID_17682 [Ustilago sp. UG-2017a]
MSLRHNSTRITILHIQSHISTRSVVKVVLLQITGFRRVTADTTLGGIPITQLRKAAYWAGINHQIALRKPFLTSKNRHKHLEWAKANSSTDWRGVLFTDEAAVKVGYQPGHTWVSCRKNTQEDINNMVLTFRSSRFSIQVWAGIAYNLKTLLVVLPLAPRKKRPGSGNQWDPAENLTAVRYRDWNIDGPLRDAVTAVSAYPDGLLVVEDGSSCHQAAICKQRRAEYNIKTQEHLPALLDLNPIENIWYVFKNLLGKRLPVPKPRDELVRAAEEVWNTQIMLEHINPVIKLMEHCVEQVLTKHGGPLKSVLQADGRYAIGQLNHCLLDPVPKLRAGTVQ